MPRVIMKPSVSGLTGLGAGVAAALAIAVGSVGGIVVKGGDIGAANGASLTVTGDLKSTGGGALWSYDSGGVNNIRMMGQASQNIIQSNLPVKFLNFGWTDQGITTGAITASGEIVGRAGSYGVPTLRGGAGNGYIGINANSMIVGDNAGNALLNVAPAKLTLLNTCAVENGSTFTSFDALSSGGGFRSRNFANTADAPITASNATLSGSLYTNNIYPYSGQLVTINTGTGYSLRWDNNGLYSNGYAQPLGTAANPWGTVTTTKVENTTTGLTLNGNGWVQFQTGGFNRWQMGPANDFYPSTTNVYNVGQSSYRVLGFYGNTLDLTGAATIAGDINLPNTHYSTAATKQTVGASDYWGAARFKASRSVAFDTAGHPDTAQVWAYSGFRVSYHAGGFVEASAPLVLNNVGNLTVPGTGTHTFGTTNTVAMTAGNLTLTGNVTNSTTALSLSGVNNVNLQVGGSTKVQVTSSNNFNPTSNNLINLGTSSLRWANYYGYGPIEIANVGGVGSGDRYTIYHTDTIYNRSVGLYHAEDGTEGGLKATSQIRMKSGGKFLVQPSSQNVIYTEQSISGGIYLHTTVGSSYVMSAAQVGYCPLTTRGLVGQAGNLLECQTSTPTTVFSVGPTGFVNGNTGARFGSSDYVDLNNTAGAGGIYQSASGNIANYLIAGASGYVDQVTRVGGVSKTSIRTLAAGVSGFELFLDSVSKFSVNSAGTTVTGGTGVANGLTALTVTDAVNATFRMSFENGPRIMFSGNEGSHILSFGGKSGGTGSNAFTERFRVDNVSNNVACYVPLVVSGSIVGTGGGVLTVGAASNRLANVYSVLGDFSSTVTASGFKSLNWTLGFNGAEAGGSISLHNSVLGATALTINQQGWTTVRDNLYINSPSLGEAGIILQQAGVGKWQLYDNGGLLRLYNYTTATQVLSVAAATGNITARGTVTGSYLVSSNDVTAGYNVYAANALFITSKGFLDAPSNGNWRLRVNNGSAPGNLDLGMITLSSDIVFAPSATITPTVNGQVTIEKTSDTSLTFKLKGSDGVVRTGSVTLS